MKLTYSDGKKNSTVRKSLFFEIQEASYDQVDEGWYC